MFAFLKYTSYVLVIVGALNWGLVGVFRFDLVAHLFGDMTKITRMIYALVGLSAIISPLSNAFFSSVKKGNM